LKAVLTGGRGEGKKKVTEEVTLIKVKYIHV
jgi:hypothetical protein